MLIPIGVLRVETVTSGNNCSTADGSPDPMCDSMRVTLDMGMAPESQMMRRVL